VVVPGYVGGPFGGARFRLLGALSVLP